jgi:hypothetical protein
MSQAKSRRKWGETIFLLKQMLGKVEAKAQRLRTHIANMEENRDGEQWPGNIPDISRYNVTKKETTQAEA